MPRFGDRPPATTRYTHHIERLMVLGNVALTSGIDPAAMTDRMWASFVDGPSG